jgi:hypothetical protein
VGLHGEWAVIDGAGLQLLPTDEGFVVGALVHFDALEFSAKVYEGVVKFVEAVALGITDLTHGEAGKEATFPSSHELDKWLSKGALATASVSVADEADFKAAVGEEEVAQAEEKEVAVRGVGEGFSQHAEVEVTLGVWLVGDIEAAGEVEGGVVGGKLDGGRADLQYPVEHVYEDAAGGGEHDGSL